MLTVPPRKTSRRVTVAAATVLLLLGVVSYTAAPAVLSEPAGVLEKLGFRKKANAEEESDECREPRAPMRALVNGAVDAVVKRVPGSNIAGKVQGGLEAKVTVMGVETVVNNISIQALSVGDVGITSCRTKGKRFQVVPDTVKVRIEGVDLKLGLVFDMPGVGIGWAKVGKAHGSAVTAISGSLSLTIAGLMDKSKPKEVTECGGDLDLGETEVVGDRMGDKGIGGLKLPPIAKLLCYGPAGIRIPGSGMMANVEIGCAEGSKCEGKGVHFEGIATMLNEHFAAKEAEGEA